MAKSLLSSTFNTRATAANSTQYWTLGTGPLTLSPTEANVSIPYGTPGTFSKLYIRITANTTVAAVTFTVRKNGADTGLTINIPPGTIGPLEDNNPSHNFTISATDKVNYKTVAPTTGAVTISIMSVIFDAETNCLSKLVADGVAHTAASVGRFSVISGAVSGVTTSGTIGNNTITKVATFKNFAIYVSANARTTNTVFTLRKNAVNGPVTLTYGNLETGLKEDTAHTSVTAVNDVLDYVTSTGAGTETLSTEYQAIEAEHATHGLISASSMGGSADQLANFGTTWYATVGGSTQIYSNETHTRQKVRGNFTFSELTLRANVNTLDGTCVVTFRKNATDTPLSVTMAPGSTTPVTDTTNTVTVTEEDEINLKIVSLGTTGAITLRQFALWAKHEEEPGGLGLGGGSSQGRPPLYRQRQVRRRQPDIAIAVVRVRIALQYEVERLSVQVKLPLLVPQKRLIKYASAILSPIARILPLPVRPTPPPPQQRIVRISIPLTYEVTNLQLKAGCSYQVDRLFTQEQQHKIVATSINFLLGDLI